MIKVTSPQKKKYKEELIEDLAKLEHDQWVEWSKAISSEVSKDRKERWEKLWIPYKDLPEDMKEEDRKYARKVFKLIKNL